MKSNKKNRRLTSSFLGVKINAIILAVVFVMFLFLTFIDFNLGGILITMIFGALSAGFWFYATRRNIVYYNQEVFTIQNWKGEVIDEVPNEKITSMLFSGYGPNYIGSSHRLFYKNENGEKKEFWIFPNSGTNTHTLKQRLKKLNPEMHTTNFSFGGIEHLFVNDEDWFK